MRPDPVVVKTMIPPTETAQPPAPTAAPSWWTYPVHPTAPLPPPRPWWPKFSASVRSALGAVAYKTCGRGGPGKVTVTFVPSGKVTAARVTSGTFAPAVIACVERAFRRVTVPPFPGPDPMTFAWSIEV